MKKRAIGLEFDDNLIYLVELSKGKDDFVIKRTSKFKEITGLNKYLEEMSSGRVSIIPPKIVLGISGLKTIIRKLVIPKTNTRELDRIIRWEAESLLPLPLEEFNFDYQILDDEGENEVLLVAVRKEEVEPYIELFTQLKIPIKMLTVQPFGLINYIKHFKLITKNYNGIIVRWGHSSIDFILLLEGKGEFYRTVPCPSNPFDNISFTTFQRELKTTLNHIHSQYNLQIKSGIFFGKRDILTSIRKNMPYFHWRYLNIKPLKEESYVGNLEEFTCCIGLALTGVHL